MSNRVKCSVEGCPGHRDIVTNGRGKAIEEPCRYCEKRSAWEAKNRPAVPPPPPCAVCGGPAPVKQSGRGRRNRKYCDACRRVVSRVHSVKAYRKSIEKPASVRRIA